MTNQTILAFGFLGLGINIDISQTIQAIKKKGWTLLSQLLFVIVESRSFCYYFMRISISFKSLPENIYNQLIGAFSGNL
ncbi:hypothetical protein [Streptococcus marmotae]|uniref:hypothetical protein n=1 Tax=Streptococcus marmotae TaxID=1825069 RepID=UPI000831C7AF|nr:hypothetical protein [Streptococcus marmotae]